jgi:hypothetical protein
MAVVEGRHQAVVLPALPPVGVVVTVEVDFKPTPTPEPTPIPIRTPPPGPTPSRPGMAEGPGGTDNVR